MMEGNMKQQLAFVVIGSMLLGSGGLAEASDPQDVGRCQALLSRGRTGLHFLHGNQLTPVNGDAVDYDARGRFYYVVPGVRGRPFRASRETIWHIRTQTIASSAKADMALLWRPGVRTQCSPDRPLETFNEYNRFVTLLRYYSHHSTKGETQRADAAIARNFHFAINVSSQRTRCDTRTDDPRTVGDLRQTYGFDDVQPNQPEIVRLTEPNRAVATTSKIYSGLSSELAIAAPGDLACFGFNAPLPTRTTSLTKVLPRWRNGEAVRQARTWRPSITTVAIQVIPPGAGLRTISVRWKE
jgi:hypothetical protein